MLSRRLNSENKENEFTREPAILSQDDDDGLPSEAESFGDFSDEKDATEQELEKLVFGDSAGFRDEIRKFSRPDFEDEVDIEELDDRAEEDYENELTRLEDADLFFVDAGPVAGTEKALIPAPASGDEDSAPEREPPAWEDSDDERLMVSLATVPRLRKLRNFEGEDLINGKEYSKRLRRQYELLNPIPDWAKSATARPPPRKRRRSHATASQSDAFSSDSSSHVDSDSDDNDEMAMDPTTHSASHSLASLLRSNQPLTRSRPRSCAFRPSVINIHQTHEVDSSSSGSLAPVSALAFHPTYPLILAANRDGTCALHQVAPSLVPTPNPQLANLHVRHAGLHTVAFAADPPGSNGGGGELRVFLAARRRYFLVWDVVRGRVERVSRVYGHGHEQRTMEGLKVAPGGRYVGLAGSGRKGGGVVSFLEGMTLQWVAQCRVESRGGIADWAWWRDGRGVSVLGRNGEVTEWDVEGRRVVGRWEDEGAVGVSVLALGGRDRNGEQQGLGGDRWVAVGSASGAVNIYDRKAWTNGRGEKGKHTAIANGDESEEYVQPMPRRPKPTKMLDQLTTAISHLTFSPDGQLLAMASRVKTNVLRLVHLPSCTVYRNWPTQGTKLGKISAVAFGEVKNQEEDEEHLYLSVANDQGRIRMWELQA
ncbi:MAG: hypothetical protein M1822_004782 [Bathelium mastoideum]|nr:MAG: hypothetical protein M1822_004782 [Bathelium mastoideum]